MILPLAKELMKNVTGKLSALEKKGYFAFGRELAGVAERIVEHYSPEDVRKFGEAVSSILDTVRAVTQPEVLAIASHATSAVQQAATTEPIGLLGVVRATRSDDVGRGLAVLMEVLRRVGHGVDSLSAKAEPSKPKLRPRSPQPAACAVPAKPAAAATVIDGVAFGADGHLVDAAQWTRSLAETLASAQGVQLSEAHWKVIDFVRADFAGTKASPNIRRITQGMGLNTKDLYALFPKAPGRTLAKIAGVPKPAGCL
jgi:tRNA 2-thiouridine synthesizing protein E